MEHATSRTQFGKKIENYGSIQEKIARLAIRQYITEVCTRSDLHLTHLPTPPTNFQYEYESLSLATRYTRYSTHFSTQSLAYMVSGIQDLGAQEFHLESAIGKVYSSVCNSYCFLAIPILKRVPSESFVVFTSTFVHACTNSLLIKH